MGSALHTVNAWQRALNEGVVETLLSLVTADVEVGGPRGSAQGADLVAQWFGRTGMTVQPKRLFCKDDTVVEELVATWHRAPDGSEQHVSAVTTFLFTVRDGKLTRIMRYDEGVATALQAAGLSNSEERTLDTLLAG